MASLESETKSTKNELEKRKHSRFKSLVSNFATTFCKQWAVQTIKYAQSLCTLHVFPCQMNKYQFLLRNFEQLSKLLLTVLRPHVCHLLLVRDSEGKGWKILHLLL